MRARIIAAVLLALAALIGTTSSLALGPGSRFIITFRSDTDKSLLAAPAHIERLASDSGFALRYLRPMSLGAHVAKLDVPVSRAQAEAIAARLRQRPDVESIDVDLVLHPAFIPNDEFYTAQRYLDDTVTGISATTAWDVTRGSPTTVVAIIDTGVLPHAGMAGRLLPGYDFISDLTTANDGDGRDPDASDPVTGFPRQISTVRSRVPIAASRTAHGTARALPVSSPPTPTTASGLRGSTGTRRCCRCACWASAAGSFPTSSTAWRGLGD